MTQRGEVTPRTSDGRRMGEAGQMPKGASSRRKVPLLPVIVTFVVALHVLFGAWFLSRPRSEVLPRGRTPHVPPQANFRWGERTFVEESTGDAVQVRQFQVSTQLVGEDELERLDREIAAAAARNEAAGTAERRPDVDDAPDGTPDVGIDVGLDVGDGGENGNASAVE